MAGGDKSEVVSPRCGNGRRVGRPFLYADVCLAPPLGVWRRRDRRAQGLSELIAAISLISGGVTRRLFVERGSSNRGATGARARAGSEHRGGGKENQKRSGGME